MNEEQDLVEIIRQRSRALVPEQTGLSARGRLPHDVKAVLFDLYGTLFISGSGGPTVTEERVDARLLAGLLSSYGIGADPEDVARRYRAEIARAHDRMREHGVDFPEVQVDRVWKGVLDFESLKHARRFAVEYESLFNPVWPMPYSKELIEELNGSGIALGIISNAQFYTPLLFRAFFDKTEMEMGFDKGLILYSYVHLRAKPSVYLFQKARAILGEKSTPPENTLFVGNDLANDVVPAYRTGFQTALFAGDRRSLRIENNAEGREGSFPDILVTSLGELGAHCKRG
jgi:putative hydrolase of the HAD superfamily